MPGRGNSHSTHLYRRRTIKNETQSRLNPTDPLNTNTHTHHTHTRIPAGRNLRWIFFFEGGCSLSVTILLNMLSIWIHEPKIPEHYVTSANLNYFLSCLEPLVNTNWLCMLPRDREGALWVRKMDAANASTKHFLLKFSYVSAMSWIDQLRQVFLFLSGLKATGGFWKSFKECVTGFHVMLFPGRLKHKK